MKTKTEGFTLIELLVVISIIGLLSTIVLVSLTTARAKGRDAVRYSDIREINNAIQLYMSDNDGRPPFLAELLVENGTYLGVSENGGTYGHSWEDDVGVVLRPYIKKMPRDPCGSSCPNLGEEGEDGYFAYQYIVLPNGTYKIYAQRLETKSGPYGFNFTSQSSLISSG